MRAWKWVAFASMIAGGACALDAGPTSGGDPESRPLDDELLSRECGGVDGPVCRTGKFCATAEANRCPGDEIKGICRHVPEACTENYQPTCGCDGQTYGNECEAARVGVAVAYDGACAPFCGGFAGLPCPGAGTCLDNPTDSCHPLDGDSDCASLCQCEVSGLCDEGGQWDSSPEVCGCVWD